MVYKFNLCLFFVLFLKISVDGMRNREEKKMRRNFENFCNVEWVVCCAFI